MTEVKSELPELLAILDLKHLGPRTYEGVNLDIGSPQVYGGQVLSQSLVASGRTVPEDRGLHSMHGYFVKRGNNALPIQYEVEEVSNGGSFCTRRVKASQNGETIFITAASYQRPEEGFDHHSGMPNVSQPESLSSFPEIFSKLAEEFEIKPKGIFAEGSAITFRPVTFYNPFNPGIQPAESHVWFRPNGPVDISNKAFMKILLSYVSDFNLLLTSLLPHNVSIFTEPLFVASLDHAMWFHRDVEVDDWMLYSIKSPSASNGRGFCTGRIFSRDGRLLASVTQEGLIRKYKK
ncbi:MAG: acyl-CoA thioesterase-2 [Saprospiraceae bacterium]|jgi:acyl-CoA thioesterase-2